MKENSFKILDKKEVIIFLIELKHPLNKISNLNKFLKEYIISFNEDPLKIYKNFRNIIFQIKNAIINHNYKMVDLKEINKIDNCIQKIEKNVVAIKQNLTSDLYEDIKKLINNDIESLKN